MRMASLNRKRGFTLVETVVTVGIVAALAAVVYPAVVKQFDSADPARVAEDLNNIRTGIEAFGVNVRPQQPDDIEDLVNALDVTGATEDSTLRGAVYSTSDGAAWLGPYLGAAVPIDTTNDAQIITTGFGATILNHFALFDINAADGGASVATASASTAEFLAVRITGLSGAAFNSINELLDGDLESTAVGRRHNGRFRCPGTAAPLDTDACTTAFYLASPLR